VKNRSAGISFWNILLHVLAILAATSIGSVAWLWRSGNLKDPPVVSTPVLTLTATPTPSAELPPFENRLAAEPGIARLARLHTTLPDFSAFQIQEYQVQPGDTIFGIAEKYRLKPQTIMWGNEDVLYDDPHRLSVGVNLKILPVDGLLYKWNEGDGLNGVSSFFGVTTEDILNWPGNNLNAETIGDYAHPNIQEGTVLFVPGGKREFRSWDVPVITRRDPGKAKVVGPGYCGTITTGLTGGGTFVWPTTQRDISGYSYDPTTNHKGIDIAGQTGNPVYAADGGVVVYAGWNDWGYGYLIVIDHGTGWQTLYAHLSSIQVGCGSSVTQGATIGAVGSTGRSTGAHLHFELSDTAGNRVNPLAYLQ